MDARAAGSDPVVGWPSAIVASMVIVLIGSVTIAAIVEYAVSDALRIWESMGTVVGLLTGAFVTFFFTRGSLQSAHLLATSAARRASQQERRADITQQALVKTAGRLDPGTWAELQRDPLIQMATSLGNTITVGAADGCGNGLPVGEPVP